jgi:hypothetical protein
MQSKNEKFQTKKSKGDTTYVKDWHGIIHLYSLNNFLLFEHPFGNTAQTELKANMNS